MVTSFKKYVRSILNTDFIRHVSSVDDVWIHNINYLLTRVDDHNQGKIKINIWENIFNPLQIVKSLSSSLDSYKTSVETDLQWTVLKLF